VVAGKPGTGGADLRLIIHNQRSLNMAAGTLSPPKVVSREEWLSARRALFVEEKEITHKLDELRKKRHLTRSRSRAAKI
jgi:hypothetical protein